MKNLTEKLMDALGQIELAVTQCSTEEPSCPRSLGMSSYKPAKSCREILRCNPSSPSGYYWLKSATTDQCQEVYCDMDTTHCDITGGWMRLAYLNMTEPGASCPHLYPTDQHTCQVVWTTHSSGCSGVTYPVDGIRYSKVCGQARGYQYHSTDAFKRVGNDNTDINSHYVDGVSITYSNPRQHIWTYASGPSIDYKSYGSYNCPCAKYPGEDPLPLLGWTITANPDSLVSIRPK